MKRINGYKIIDDYSCKYLSNKKISRHKIYKLSNGNLEYFFKIVDKETQYKELFYSIILQNLGFNTVINDLAKYQDECGIISLNYNPKNLPKFSLADIIYECRKMEFKKNQRLFNIENILETIYVFCSKYKYTFYENIKEELFLRFIMQIFLANSDLSESNIEFIVAENFEISPYYDFESCGLVNLKNDDDYSRLMNTYIFEYNSKIKNYASAYEILINFLEIGTIEEIKIFKFWLEKMQELNLEKIISTMEERIHYHIPSALKLNLTRKFIKNIQNIKTSVEKTKH